MTKPIEKMTVEELQHAVVDWMDGDIPDCNKLVDPIDIFDELARRNKLLVEALEIYGVHDQSCSMRGSFDAECNCGLVAAIKQSEGEL